MLVLKPNVKYSLNMFEFFLLMPVIGIVSGLLAGLFGLGGGIVVVPALLWLFMEQHFPANQIMVMAIATSLATIALTSVASLLSHHKLGTILWDKVYPLVPGILLGSAAGAKLADWAATDVLRWLFIAYLIYAGLRMALPASIKNKKPSAWLDLLAGNGIGLVSSLLGIGGGTLTVPYLVGRQIPMRNAVAISSVCGLPIALSGSLVYAMLGRDNVALPEWSLGYIYLPAFFGITACSILTAPLGAKLAQVLPAKTLKRYFSVVLFLVAIAMVP